MYKFIFFPLVIVFSCFFVLEGRATTFEDWTTAFKDEALSKGISQKTLDMAFANIRHIDRVIELDRKQPEGRLTFAEYKKRVISQARIDQGRRMMRQHRAELDKASKKYGVQPQYIVALWGVETSYGNNTGGFDVVSSLATLAYDGRRADFFRSELINALKILDAGHIDVKNMRGSWAGAMGQNQFMPSSFHSFAVDGNNDGKRDIWTSLPDVFASTANYLSKSGWKGDERWGRKIQLPRNFDESLVGLETQKSLKEWQALGVRRLGGGDIPIVSGFQASVIAPDGISGPAYLAYDNFRVILKWNRSTYFASSVGILADYIAQ